MITPKPHAQPKLDSASIENQAKQIMDAFLKELGSIEQPKHFGLKREGLAAQVRDASTHPANPQFRQAFLANAPKVKDDELVMERKQW